MKAGKSNQNKTLNFAVASLGLSGAGTLELWRVLLDVAIAADISYFSDSSSLSNAARAWPGRMILFSNFPPDSDNGFTYNDSKKFFGELFAGHPDIALHIITNAGGKTLTDSEVISLFPKARVTIQRPWQWADYAAGFVGCVVQRLRESLPEPGLVVKLNGGCEKWDKPPEPANMESDFPKWCATADPMASKPPNGNVDEASFRIWQKSNRIEAARKYGKISGD